MPRRPSFSPKLTRYGWQVEIPPAMSSTGERRRLFFPTRTEADKCAASARREYHAGLRGQVIPAATAADALAALELLDPHGISLLQAAKTAVSGLGVGSPETFRERYARAMADGEGRWSDIYAKDMGKLPDWLGEEIMDRRCADITREDFEMALGVKAKARSTLDHRMRYVMSVQNFKPKHRKKTTDDLMTSDQVDLMLDAARTQAEKWAVAILLFAGIRPDAEYGEITRLDWSAFGESEVYIEAEIAKTGTDRHIPITPRLARLIEGHPKSGAVLPSGWRKAYQRIRKAAGLGMLQDPTRHVFASHFLAAFSEDATKQALGHSEGSRTLFKHYRKAVTKADGEAYFR